MPKMPAPNACSDSKHCHSFYRDSKSLLGFPPFATEMTCDTIPTSTWNMLSKAFWVQYSKKLPRFEEGYKKMTQASLELEEKWRENKERKGGHVEKENVVETSLNGVAKEVQSQTDASASSSNTNSPSAPTTSNSPSSAPLIGHQSILWMKGPLCPQNIFVRTLDTGRLLPMSRFIGDPQNPDAWYDGRSDAALGSRSGGLTTKTRVKLWMHKWLVERIEKLDTEEKETMIQQTLFSMIHELHYLNALHEYPPHTTYPTSSITTSDIHVIMGDFSEDLIIMVGEYFQLMSKAFMAEMKVKEVKESKDGKGKAKERVQEKSLKELEWEAKKLLDELRAKEHFLLHYFRSNNHLSPCFPQLDLAFRSILYSHLHRDFRTRHPLPTAPPHFPDYYDPMEDFDDGPLGDGAHPPPFVILYTTRLGEPIGEDSSGERQLKKNFGRPLFTSPRWTPDPRILKAWPASCASPKCSEGNDCDVIRLPRTEKETQWGEMDPVEWAASWDAVGFGSNGPNRSDEDKEEVMPSLEDNSDVESEKGEGHPVLCNFMWCPDSGGPPFELSSLKPEEIKKRYKTRAAKKLCTRCKRVVYCSQSCQKADWGTHKRICALEPLWK